MAPKRHAVSNTGGGTAAAAASSSSPSSASQSSSKVTQRSTNSSSGLAPNSSPQAIIQHVWQRYLAQTPQRTLLLDAFMAFLVLVGGIQFVYCVLAGNYPFNAFLSGFSAAVGQFVLTASLRMQTSSTDGGRDKKTGLSSSPSKGAAEQITQGISTER
ncbi:DAD family domain containing protein [Elaphomyces granulatus]